MSACDVAACVDGGPPRGKGGGGSGRKGPGWGREVWRGGRRADLGEPGVGRTGWTGRSPRRAGPGQHEVCALSHPSLSAPVSPIALCAPARRAARARVAGGYQAPTGAGTAAAARRRRSGGGGDEVRDGSGGRRRGAAYTHHSESKGFGPLRADRDWERSAVGQGGGASGVTVVMETRNERLPALKARAGVYRG